MKNLKIASIVFAFMIAAIAFASITVNINTVGGYSTSATQISVATAQVTIVPKPQNFGPIVGDWYIVQGGNPQLQEQVLLTGITGNTLTVQRGYNGTVPVTKYASNTYYLHFNVSGTMIVTYTPTVVPTNTPTGTATNTPVNTATNTATGTATNTRTNTATSTATNTPTNTATSTSTATATPITYAVDGTGTTLVTIARGILATDAFSATYSSPCTNCGGPLQAFGIGVTAIGVVPSAGTTGVWNATIGVIHR